MTSSSSTNGKSDLLLTRLADEFAVRIRAGEAPEVHEDAAGHPELGDELRDLLSTVAAIERVPSGAAEAAAPIKRLGEYRIERQIGRGGMGVVYLATQESLDRQVAIKFLPVQATLDPRFLERFHREARAAGRLQHPNIVPVYGVGEDQGLHYFAMQYVDGHPLDVVVRTLRDWNDDRPPSGRAGSDSSAETLAVRLLSGDSSDESNGGEPGGGLNASSRRAYCRNVARIGAEVGEALAYAHSHGVLHRDIKPGNLLLDGAGKVWVTDFGLCKTAEADQLTATTDMVGTLRYMAPEQVGGRGDVRSDVYGLGITLYELLTLRVPFAKTNRAALIAQVTNDEPPRPRRIDPAIPRDLEAIVLKATAKLPEERYGTAEALVEDLFAFLDGRPIDARPPGVLHLLRLALRRHKVLVGTITAALVVLLAVSVFYIDGLRDARAEQDHHLYQASIAAAAAASSFPATASRYLDRAPEHLRDWEWEQLAASLDSSLTTVASENDLIHALDVSADGRVVVRGGFGVRVRELVEPHREWLADGPIVTSIDVRPDGAEAAFGGQWRLCIVSLTAGTILADVTRPHSEVTAVCYSVDGQRIFVGDRQGRIVCYGPGLGEELFAFPTVHGSWVLDLAVTRDGRQLLSVGKDGTVREHDLETLDSRVLGRHQAWAVTVDVDATGRFVASGGSDGSLLLWDRQNGRPLASWAGHEGRVRSARLTEDGARLVSAGDDRRIRVWDARDGKPLNELTGNDSSIIAARFLPDGRLITGGLNGVVKTWDIDAIGGSVILPGHLADLWSVAFDASGERLVSTSRDGTVRVWDAVTGRALRVFVHTMPGAAVFSPDGRHVLAGYKNGSMRLWDLDTSASIWEHRRGEDEADEDVRIAFWPEGDRFTTVTYRRGVDVWARRGDGWVRERSVELPQASTMAVSLSNEHVAVGCWDGTVVLLENGTLRHVWKTPKLDDLNVTPRFSPDGALLAVGGQSGRIWIWVVEDGSLEREWVVEPRGSERSSTIWDLGFNAAGTRLACATENLGITLWDPATGEQMGRLQARQRGHMRALFSPDGERLVTAAWPGLIRIWDTTRAADRLAHIRVTPPDPVAEEQAARGTLAGIVGVIRTHLRSTDTTSEDLYQASVLIRGLLKEYDADPRARAVAGESHYRHGSYPVARAHLRGSVETSELTGEPNFDANLFLAMTEAKLGDLEAARTALATARAQAGPDDEVHARLLAEAARVLGAAE